MKCENSLLGDVRKDRLPCARSATASGFSGKSEDEVKAHIKAASRAYAKKQYTYMRNIPGAAAFPYDGSIEAARKIAEAAVAPFLEKHGISVTRVRRFCK